MRKNITFNTENPVHKEAADILKKVGKPYNDFVAKAIIFYFENGETQKNSIFEERVLVAMEKHREWIEVIVKDTMLMILAGKELTARQNEVKRQKRQNIDNDVIPEYSLTEIPRKNVEKLASILSESFL